MIRLYTAPTPNGWKVSVALEELGGRLGESPWLAGADLSIADLAVPTPMRALDAEPDEERTQAITENARKRLQRGPGPQC